jgi:hypothetical protein
VEKAEVEFECTVFLLLCNECHPEPVEGLTNERIMRLIEMHAQAWLRQAQPDTSAETLIAGPRTTSVLGKGLAGTPGFPSAGNFKYSTLLFATISWMMETCLIAGKT